MGTLGKVYTLLEPPPPWGEGGPGSLPVVGVKLLPS